MDEPTLRAALTAMTPDARQALASNSAKAVHDVAARVTSLCNGVSPEVIDHLQFVPQDEAWVQVYKLSHDLTQAADSLNDLQVRTAKALQAAEAEEPGTENEMWAVLRQEWSATFALLGQHGPKVVNDLHTWQHCQLLVRMGEWEAYCQRLGVQSKPLLHPSWQVDALAQALTRAVEQGADVAKLEDYAKQWGDLPEWLTPFKAKHAETMVPLLYRIWQQKTTKDIAEMQGLLDAARADPNFTMRVKKGESVMDVMSRKVSEDIDRMVMEEWGKELEAELESDEERERETVARLIFLLGQAKFEEAEKLDEESGALLEQDHRDTPALLAMIDKWDQWLKSLGEGHEIPAEYMDVLILLNARVCEVKREQWRRTVTNTLAEVNADSCAPGWVKNTGHLWLNELTRIQKDNWERMRAFYPDARPELAEGMELSKEQLSALARATRLSKGDFIRGVVPHDEMTGLLMWAKAIHTTPTTYDADSAKELREMTEKVLRSGDVDNAKGVARVTTLVNAWKHLVNGCEVQEEDRLPLALATTRLGQLLAGMGPEDQTSVDARKRLHEDAGFVQMLAQGSEYAVQKVAAQDIIARLMESWVALANRNTSTAFASLLTPDQYKIWIQFSDRHARDQRANSLAFRSSEALKGPEYQWAVVVSLLNEWEILRINMLGQGDDHAAFHAYLAEDQRVAYQQVLNVAHREWMERWGRKEKLASPPTTLGAAEELSRLNEHLVDYHARIRSFGPVKTRDAARPALSEQETLTLASYCRWLWLGKVDDAFPSREEKEAASKIAYLLSTEVLSPKDLHTLIQKEDRALNRRSEARAKLAVLIDETQGVVKYGAPMRAARALLDKWDKVRTSLPQEQWCDILSDEWRNLLLALRGGTSGAVRDQERFIGSQEGGRLRPRYGAVNVPTGKPVSEEELAERRKVPADLFERQAMALSHQTAMAAMDAELADLFGPPHEVTQEMTMPADPSIHVGMNAQVGGMPKTASQAQAKEAQGQETAQTKGPGRMHEVKETLTRDGTEAAWRTAGNQLVKLTRDPLVGVLSRHLGPDDEAMRKKIADFLATEAGTAMLAGLLSIGLSAMPATAGETPQRLARELRVKAMADMGDLVAEVLMGPMRQVIASYLQDMPTMEALPPAPAQLVAPLPAGIDYDFGQAKLKAE